MQCDIADQSLESNLDNTQENKMVSLEHVRVLFSELKFDTARTSHRNILNRLTPYSLWYYSHNVSIILLSGKF